MTGGTPFWQTLLLMLLSASIAGGFAVVSPWFAEDRKEKTERRRMRVVKFEELVSTIFDHKHWLDIKASIYVFGEKREPPPAPITKALAIAITYLPELADEVAKIEKASYEYELWMLKAGQKRLTTKKTTSVIDGQAEAHTKYITVVAEALKKVKEFPKGNFN